MYNENVYNENVKNENGNIENMYYRAKLFIALSMQQSSI